MKLVDNWRRVLRRAWSVRLLALASLFAGLEVAVPHLEAVLPVSKGGFALLSFVATSGAFVSRFVAQKSVSGED